MLPNIKNFIADFQSSGIIDQICAEYDVVMIWVSGSTALGIVDEESDYDLGVLITDNVQFSKSEKTPIYFRYKKEDNRAVQYIFNTFEDVFAEICRERLAPYRYLGWAQFINIKEEHIIYKNNKYLDIIDQLILNKESISHNAIHTFVNYVDDAILSIHTPRDIFRVPWGKMLSHLVWCADILTKRPVDTALLLRLKRNPEEEPDAATTADIFNKLLFLQEYLQKAPNPLALPFLTKIRTIHIGES
jgi:predicted nucleotidyltransferase